MKKLISLVLVLCLCLSFAACSLLGGAKGEVYVSADGERYATTVNSVKENGYKDVEFFMAEIGQMIPYGSGITLGIDGDRTGELKFSLYDGEGNEFYSGEAALEIPVAVGTYYCIMEVNWGDEAYSETYQHAFCFVRSK